MRHTASGVARRMMRPCGAKPGLLMMLLSSMVGTVQPSRTGSTKLQGPMRAQMRRTAFNSMAS